MVFNNQKLIKKISGIQGMRAIAVIAVIIYHFDSNILPSGYLGVDLFFIISGFVIARQLSIIKSEKISEYLLYFYNSRFKRIFPALIVFIILTLLLLIYTNQLNVIQLRTGAFSLIGLSNIYLMWIENDYFGIQKTFNVFNHTWSLGIEQQFYFFIPFIMFFLKESKKKILFILLALTIFSFGSYIILSNNIIFQYYSIITRLWQFMIGSLGFYLLVNYNIKIKPIWTKLSFLIVIICLTLDSDYINFSSPVLCLMGLIVIWGVTNKDQFFLSNKYLVYIGGISYSLYLYHLPIILFFNFPGYWSITQFIFLFIIAILSAEFVEKPFRNLKIAKFKAIFFWIITTSVICFLMLISTKIFNFNEKYFSTPKHDNIYPIQWNEIDKIKMNSYSKGLNQLFFVGDSHSDALTPLMELLHEKNNKGINSISSGGLFTISMNSENKEYSIRGRAILNYILKNGKKGDVLIITNQLMNWFSKTYANPSGSLFYENHNSSIKNNLLTQNKALFHYFKDLVHISNVLNDKKMDIIIVAPFPDFPVSPIKCYSALLDALDISMNYKKCRIKRSEQDKRRKNILKILNHVSSINLNFHIIDPIDLVSDTDYISAFKGNIPLYYDDDHPNYIFNQYLYPLFLEKLNTIEYKNIK
tara:strand:- start:854 stop:2782 length:1929 start_codon:yes stop_codon:yes gene_type:complete